MSRRYHLAGGIALLVFCQLAAASSYTSLAPILADAIDHGSSYGALRGPLADSLTRQLTANGPVYVSARPIGDLPRAGCKRLDLVFDIRGVQTPAGETTGKLDMQMNYCRDGVPPIGLGDDRAGAGRQASSGAVAH
ncbi:hypothetical protein GIY62_35280 (plasmid) [Burkholderia plantarii]|uniref:hypothetical protein n=1 Tax=Burkholderia plantarii TaxID=41899 RepID=UPI00272D3640|nr:hypothetical protein [Burkholderia plantarii]WLE64127.1 hypothetical protein GIY62_35280 [Burkholderia plantarii]